MGLHRRYSGILGEPGTVMTLADENAIDKKLLAKLRERFSRMMSALFKEDGAQLRIEILNEPEITDFIDTHTEILSSPLQESGMSELMKTRLTESNYIFSGIKTFHELNEAFPSLLDEKGKRKPFEQFLNDVQKIDKTYNGNYLRAEYNFAQASAGMTEKWEQFTEDGDDYLLQYRTANDSKVRPEHAELHGITLPAEDNFWDEYFPPNGWNCRCTVVQVLKSRYEQTPHSEAMERGQQVLQTDKQKMFRFNPGKTGSSFPAHNPYTISRCTTCDLAKLNLASGVTDNELCAACQMVRNCAIVERFTPDKDYGDRLLVSVCADKSEVEANTRVAKVLLDSFPDMKIKILPHIFKEYKKNPEYEIDGKLADRKGIESENGVSSGFSKGVKQSCRIIVLDLDVHMSGQPLRDKILSKNLSFRYADFKNDTIVGCYVIYHGKSVLIDKSHFSAKDRWGNQELIRNELKKIAE